MKIGIVSFSLLAACLLPKVASAHELIPKAVQEYIQKNPQATAQQVKEFSEQAAPEFSEKIGDGNNIIELVKNPDTSFIDNSIDFIRLGIEHILDGPDHILFVLSLLLVFLSIKEILKLSITFTLAHSVTLILSGAGILSLSSDIVEPLIALSISVMAIYTVFFYNKKYLDNPRIKAGIVFFFGLFHGLGFAGLLKEIQIPQDRFLTSLISFNIGIELGQILIVLLALPFIYLFKDKSWYPYAIKIFAILIALTGVVWFMQRVLV